MKVLWKCVPLTSNTDFKAAGYYCDYYDTTIWMIFSYSLAVDMTAKGFNTSIPGLHPNLDDNKHTHKTYKFQKIIGSHSLSAQKMTCAIIMCAIINRQEIGKPIKNQSLKWCFSVLWVMTIIVARLESVRNRRMFPREEIHPAAMFSAALTWCKWKYGHT